ncbi:MAG: hypothetical protein AAGE52_28105 [Myxococcota bacterium]
MGRSVIVSQGDSHCFVGVGNVLITLYWGTPTAQALRDRLPWVRATLAKYQGVGLLVVVDSRAAGTLPDGSFREESRTQAAEFGDRVYVSASAIEGDSLMHSLVRTFLRGLAVVSNVGFPVRFFANLSEAAGLVAELSEEPSSPSAGELVAALEAARPSTISQPAS